MLHNLGTLCFHTCYFVWLGFKDKACAFFFTIHVSFFSVNGKLQAGSEIVFCNKRVTRLQSIRLGFHAIRIYTDLMNTTAL